MRPSLRNAAIGLGGSSAFTKAVALVDRHLPRSNHRISVLTYHRITETDAPPGLVSATPAAFERQMEMLANDFQVVSMDHLLAARRGEAELPSRAVLLTFDDGYADFGESAWPILRRHGLPVTLFVPTAYPDALDRLFWWDRLYNALNAGAENVQTPLGLLQLEGKEDRLRSYRILRDWIKRQPHTQAMECVAEIELELNPVASPSLVMGWDELRRLAAEGVTLAPHSHTHPLLNRIGFQQLEQEIGTSREELRRQTGAYVPAFAYPAGGYSAQVAAALEKAGIELAFTCVRGVNKLGKLDHLDWFALRRIPIGTATTPGIIRAQMMTPSALRRQQAAKSNREQPDPPAVAYIMSRFPKLSETFILTEILAVQSRGVRVELYPLVRHKESTVHPEAERLVEAAHYQPFLSWPIIRSQLHFLRHRPLTYVQTLLAVLRGTWRSLNFLGGGVAVFPKVAHSARLMESDGVRHVHCHFATHPALAGFVIHRLTGIPYSFTAHGSDLHVDRTMLREKVNEAKFAATISDYNRRLILAECGPEFESKIDVIRAGIELNSFKSHTDPLSTGELRIICVGTLHEVKGQGYLISACAQLAEWGVPFVCRIVGDGPDHKLLSQQIQTTSLEGRVVLEGARKRGEVAELLAQSNVLVAPSVPTNAGKREGIPVVLMEAMGSTLPVIASDLSGIPELVENEITGLLVAPKDVVGLASALRRLHTDQGLATRLAKAGCARVHEEFDVYLSAQQLITRFGLEPGR